MSVQNGNPLSKAKPLFRGKPLVYVASPYTKGDVAVNTHFQLKVFAELAKEDIVIPYCPLWSHFQHVFSPLPYKFWTEYDLELIYRTTFDACLRLDVTVENYLDETAKPYFMHASSGADGEVAAFEELQLPVFYDKTSLYDWAQDAQAKRQKIRETVEQAFRQS